MNDSISQMETNLDALLFDSHQAKAVDEMLRDTIRESRVCSIKGTLQSILDLKDYIDGIYYKLPEPPKDNTKMNKFWTGAIDLVRDNLKSSCQCKEI